jgi:iron complex transport system ATP-binding protein
MTALAASQIAFRRSGRAILDSVSFRAQSGEFVAVIGPNGAGKSTLLSVLAGLVSPDGGEVALDGEPLSAVPRNALAKRRSYLPQNPRCEWPIPVERLVALGLTPVLPAFGALPPAMQFRVKSVLEDYDLLDRRDQPATTLSGGELARAMLARALVADPDILIVDEPATGLDPRHALDAMLRLADLARGGKLVIASLHDLTAVARYATRVVALNNGRVAADGPPREILQASLLRQIFSVDARIADTPGGPFVDYLRSAG